MDRIWHKRLHDFEWIDRVEMVVVPRWKTSGLSGNEWRQHVEVVCSFKGVEVLRFGARDMDAAMAMLPGRVLAAGEDGVESDYLARERATCDQPSCCQEPVAFVRLKRETATNGTLLDPEDCSLPHYRKFCAEHRVRGDCSREDADSNYEAIDNPRTEPAR